MTRKETKLCTKCGQFPAYVGPNGKQYNLCALCGWESLQILLSLTNAKEDSEPSSD
jgi:hypothetical protein